ncbi:MAG: EXLDI protein [Candidatus Aquicultor sp.]
MANRTIYVSKKDEEVFEEAQEIAGEALSSVIARALREFVARSKEKQQGMKEVRITVGAKGSEREQRFIGSRVGKWQGFSDDKEWWLSAKIYITQKSNWAVCLTTISKASLMTNPKDWKKSGAYLENSNYSELFVAPKPEQLEGRIPAELLKVVKDLAEREENAVEYLDI